MTVDLFGGYDGQPLTLQSGALVLPRFAESRSAALVQAIAAVAAVAPFRRMETPGGFTMSAAMTNCGPLGWVSDRTGYRYQTDDPTTGKPWPAMLSIMRNLAMEAAVEAGFPGFEPDACLVNRYQPGARMSLHQDRNEQDFSQPIVSVSLGLSMVFLFGGLRRQDKTQKITLSHGDVVVWGGPSRLRYHGVLALKPGSHPQTGACRYNLTFRRAG
ncbi:DNA oxidative demethylase AlkB [Marinobacter zhejiangensis]|uniref:Alkylated DNA repair protein (DNA oxidative demethylase) n=1 Tax=Marinobacter zhejiangensis TaxID=488535 RepID=A0A1I4NF17_9GAMM|nr:DNA oxidative demethylase AlkB [Marinobacter zhejiangensis]SFM13985.1 alkylated DNA repair protein (DNA oxidative demethylase) [Marinobacter zhejiangensis]